MSGGITQSSQSLNPPPVWSVVPNETDWLAWAAIISIGLAVYLVIFLYAKFDHWAEQQAEGTPLAKTIPTLLGIALLYEIFPLDHFSILLPLSAILIALVADWRREQGGKQNKSDEPTTIDPEGAIPDQEPLVKEIEIAKMDQESTKIDPIDSTKNELEPKEATNV